jgi:DNA processing protein
VHDQGYPDVLLSDTEAPAVLFIRGNSDVLSHRRVGIVGTRNATQRGKYFARELGAALAGEGVCVVSGLARGIDVESHVGAL